MVLEGPAEQNAPQAQCGTRKCVCRNWRQLSIAFLSMPPAIGGGYAQQPGGQQSTSHAERQRQQHCQLTIATVLVLEPPSPASTPASCASDDARRGGGGGGAGPAAAPLAPPCAPAAPGALLACSACVDKPPSLDATAGRGMAYETKWLGMH